MPADIAKKFDKLFNKEQRPHIPLRPLTTDRQVVYFAMDMIPAKVYKASLPRYFTVLLCKFFVIEFANLVRDLGSIPTPDQILERIPVVEVTASLLSIHDTEVSSLKIFDTTIQDLELENDSPLPVSSERLPLRIQRKLPSTSPLRTLDEQKVLPLVNTILGTSALANAVLN